MFSLCDKIQLLPVSLDTQKVISSVLLFKTEKKCPLLYLLRLNVLQEKHTKNF